MRSDTQYREKGTELKCAESETDEQTNKQTVVPWRRRDRWMPLAFSLAVTMRA